MHTVQIRVAWKLVRKELDNAIGHLKAAGLYRSPDQRGTKRTANGDDKVGVVSFLAEEQEAAQGSACTIADVIQNIDHPDAADILTQNGEGLRHWTEVKQELTAYLMIRPLTLDADPLAWWRLYRHQFPGLARVAMYYLCICASSAAVDERFFSGMGLTVSALRACLSSESLQALVYLRLNWEECLYHVDYQAPKNEAEEAAEREEPESEGEDDYVEEVEERMRQRRYLILSS